MPSKRKPKNYPIHQSPFFMLRGKGQFLSVIGVEWESYKQLLAPNLYKVWETKKGREIQQPIGWLAVIHKRIGNLLARIEVPDYVFSQKGRSYADNARQHLGNTALAKTDINKFYPSTTRSMVFKMFCDDFRCAEDIAHALADICCYQQKHLPTGSPLSGRIAFLASRQMFEDISGVALREKCVMTAYVDDITVSGAGATKKVLGEIRQIVSKYGHKTKKKKSLTYAPYAPKEVTGAIVHGSKLLLPNARHLKLWLAKAQFSIAVGPDRDKAFREVKGREQEARQILFPK